jgi:hypothetical protein
MAIDIKHALSGKDAQAWRKAIHSELASLHNKGTFRMKNLPRKYRWEQVSLQGKGQTG